MYPESDTRGSLHDTRRPSLHHAPRRVGRDGVKVMANLGDAEDILLCAQRPVGVRLDGQEEGELLRGVLAGEPE